MNSRQCFYNICVINDILNVSNINDNITYSEMAGLVRMALDKYVTVVDELSDPRTTDWMFISSPIPTIVMILVYLYVVLLLGPRIMANRKPFKLQKILIFYNGAQVLLSLYMFCEHLMSGWFWDYSLICQPVDYSYNKKAMRMATLCWWYYLSKLSEFADTVFFVLRKKDSQVSLLHLYHHSLTPIETWILVKFIAGGHGTFSNLINNIVHVIMYFYYMVAAMGPEYQKYLWWKKYLTTVQLLQFLIVIIHSIQLLFIDCGYPQFVGYLLVLHSSIFLALFSHFYYQTYKPQKKQIKQE